MYTSKNIKLKITILIDSPRNWMIKYMKDFVTKINTKHDLKICYDPKNIERGDIAFILSFYKIVPEKILKLNKHNIVVHASNLPQGKGWSPATWQILEGKNKIPLTLFEAVDKVDAGAVYFRENLDLDGTELINDWQNKMGKKIIEMVIKFIQKLNHLKSHPQTGEESFYKKRVPKDSRLDIDKSIKDQFNLLRIVDNKKYPAFFEYKGKKFIIKIYKG